MYNLISRFGVIILIILISFLFRALVALGGYSGYNDPPQFGDYEAQRHWMELTLHTPTKEWYIYTDHNSPKYWPIDYPPLTAYVSYLFGYVEMIYKIPF